MTQAKPTIRVTDIGEYIRYHSCDRRFKLKFNNYEEARKVPFFELIFETSLIGYFKKLEGFEKMSGKLRFKKMVLLILLNTDRKLLKKILKRLGASLLIAYKI